VGAAKARLALLSAKVWPSATAWELATLARYVVHARHLVRPAKARLALLGAKGWLYATVWELAEFAPLGHRTQFICGLSLPLAHVEKWVFIHNF